MANILIVDDGVIFGQTENLRKTLEEFGHNVSEAMKDSAAFKACEQQTYGLIIMDLNLTMDSLDGVELTKELKKRGVRAKFILYCGSSLGISQDKEIAELFDFIIGKGNENQLITTIEHLFSKRNLEKRH